MKNTEHMQEKPSTKGNMLHWEFKHHSVDVHIMFLDNASKVFILIFFLQIPYLRKIKY